MGHGSEAKIRMDTLIRNSEYKRLLLKLGILQIVFLTILYFTYNFELEKLNKSFVEQNIAIAGKIINKNPDLEKDLLKNLFKGADENEYKKGKKLLSKYNYSKNLDVELNHIFDQKITNLKFKPLILFCLLFVIFFFLISIDYRNMYLKIKVFAKKAEEINEGTYTNYLDDSREGEFGILGHNLNQLNKRLNRSIAKLKEDKDFLKGIISDISHQLKTPLSSLLMINEILLTDKSMKENVRIDFYNKVNMQLERMEWLVISLLKYARLEAGAIILKNEKFCLLDSINQTLKYLNNKIEAKNISLILDSNLNGIYLNGDEKWFTEAIINIVKNSIEHSYENGLIEIKSEVNMMFIRVFIKDHGEGIDNKDLSHIFERFKTGKSDIKCESIGIGLWLSKIIIENLGGAVSAKSKLKEGSEFTITFFLNELRK